MKWESQLFKCDRRGFRVTGRDCDMYFQDGNGQQCPADCPIRAEKKAATDVAPAFPKPARKTCKTCKITHDIDDFPKNARAKDGHLNTCRKCFGERISKSHAEGKKPKTEKPVRKTVNTETPEKETSDVWEPVRKIIKESETTDIHKITLDFSKHPNIYNDLIESAETDFRSPDMQILAILDKTFKLN